MFYGTVPILNTLSYYAVLPNRMINDWKENPNNFVMDSEEMVS